MVEMHRAILLLTLPVAISVGLILANWDDSRVAIELGVAYVAGTTVGVIWLRHRQSRAVRDQNH